jgi:hypothetical protein
LRTALEAPVSGVNFSTASRNRRDGRRDDVRVTLVAGKAA